MSVFSSDDKILRLYDVCRNFILGHIESYKCFIEDIRKTFSDFSISSSYTKYALKVSIAACLALGSAFFLELPDPNWSVWTACTVMLPNIASSVKKALHRFFGTWICFVIALIFYGLFFNNHIFFTLAIFLYITYFTYKRATGGYDYYFWWILADVMIVITFPTISGEPGSAVYTGSYRAMNITNGIFWSFIVNFYLWPNYIQDTLHESAKKIRLKYHSFISTLFNSFTSNEYDRKNFDNIYKELNSAFVKLKDVLHYTEVERKFSKKEEASADLNIGDLEFQFYDAWRFYEQLSIFRSEYQKRYADKFSQILGKLYKLIESLNNGGFKAFELVSSEIGSDLNSLISYYEQDEQKASYPDKDSSVVLEAITILNSLYMHIKESLENKTIKEIYQTTDTLIDQYTYWKEFSLCKVRFRFQELFMKQAIKSGLCIVTIIWLTLAMRFALDVSIMSAFAAILFMRPKMTDDYDIFFIIIFATFCNLVVSLIFIMFFGDYTFMLFIFTFIISFFCFYLKNACTKPIMWAFTIWLLNCYTGGQLEGVTPTLSIWPLLTLFCMTLIGVILVYIFNNLIWRYSDDSDFKAKLVSIETLCGKVKLSFKDYLQGKPAIFGKYAGFSKVLNQMSLLAIKGRISQEEKDYYLKSMNSLKWIFYELRSLMVLNERTFREVYALNRNFFDKIIDSISDIEITKPGMDEKDLLELRINELESGLSELESAFYSSSYCSSNAREKTLYVNKLFSSRRILSLYKAIISD
ncbi:MAG TPA: hypothetical protein DD381_09230 [Lentisphaeria bacterium]|nr:MAG: hypothetical protein A2X47_13575 [Lentisphaerae bacterium GWF2_38_69]HBM16505.1 hypothetical protein [Lentisphaeria bacterium]